MNDSFLEDLNLLPPTQKPGSTVHPAEKYITSRNSQSPTSRDLNSERDELEALIKQQLKSSTPVLQSSSTQKTSNKKSIEKTASPITSQPTINVPVPLDITPKKKSDIKDKKNEIKKQSRDGKYITTKSKLTDKKAHVNEEKLKPVENIDYIEIPKSNSLPKGRTKKLSEPKECSKLSDGSLKENNKPSDSSEDTSSDVVKEPKRISTEVPKQKNEVRGEKDSTITINAVKNIVSECTKAESARVMKMMQDLYINSQMSLVKQLMLVSDDIRDTLSTNDSPQVQKLIQENEQLKNSIVFFKNKIEELQKAADSVEKVRQENIALKKKIHELEK
ncbi:uncharacterized protein [Chelonus insularis]|uniref:uncharacterized protein n=1 Tax=Chelonus insularis TaxID=460826 RepID=UPI00158B6EA5|nr:uncharacterized protein LOC118074300 [Chelonus insularis]XP_034951300.1 uncharacterized protein LOC118074300 [Chelonus insularis]